MIVVTGATGHLGRVLLLELLKRAPGVPLGASVRDPDKAGDLAARGVLVRRGDYRDRASLVQAFAGASQVLLVSSDAEARGGDAVTEHGNAIAAARAAGVGRIVYTSHMGASAHSKFPPMRTHAATEALLAASGVPFTALRNGFYAESATRMLGNVAETHALVAPEDGKVAWTDHADLAAAAAAILLDAGRFDGATPPLTGAEALDLQGLAALASEILGVEVSRRVVADADFTAGLVAGGMPAASAEMLLGLHEASRRGEFGSVDPTLAQLIGRSPVSMREVLAAHFRSADHKELRP